MATPEQDAFDTLMRRVQDELPEPEWSGVGDLSRMSVEAMASQREDVRELRSEGVVRLTGAGVTLHSADLDEVGQVATLWQKCVTAIGAALEGTRSAVGRIPEHVRLRTQLQLNAGAAAGSVTLAVSPKTDPLTEVAPGGMRIMFDAPRPLADRASETLIAVLNGAASADPLSTALGSQLRDLGPRVATSIKTLADVLNKAHFDLDASWAEPEEMTVRSKVSAGQMGWLRDFVSGRALDAVEEELSGVVRTVSDVAKWAVETSEGLVTVAATNLGNEEVRTTTVGQEVRMVVLVRVTERPDGSTSTTRDAVRML